MSVIENIKETLKNAWDDVVDATGIAYVGQPLEYGREDDSTVTTLAVPGYRQSQFFSCGYVAGLMVVHTFYPRRSPTSFWNKVLPDRENGVMTPQLVAALRQSKIRVSVRQNLNFEDIETQIEAGRPIIALLKHGHCVDHWVVIYGVGRSPKRVFIAGSGLPHFSSGIWTWAEYRRDRAPGGDYLICSAK